MTKYELEEEIVRLKEELNETQYRFYNEQRGRESAQKELMYVIFFGFVLISVLGLTAC